jgi:AcrR family transcriptional regulator
MPRKKGSQNADFAAAKQELLTRIRRALLGDAPPSSFRSLAAAAGVTIPTLRHYFGDRDAVIAAVFADCHSGGKHELQIARTPTGPLRASLQDFVRHFLGGLQYGGLDRLNAVGLVEGLNHPRVAQSYLSEVLEPTLVALQDRFQVHIDRTEMRAVNPRFAAIGFVSPLLLLVLHQNGLGGSANYPTEVDAFAREHTEAFLTAHEIVPPPGRASTDR